MKITNREIMTLGSRGRFNLETTYLCVDDGEDDFGQPESWESFRGEAETIDWELTLSAEWNWEEECWVICGKGSDTWGKDVKPWVPFEMYRHLKERGLSYSHNGLTYPYQQYTYKEVEIIADFANALPIVHTRPYTREDYEGI